jgi:hypothetical protein
MSENNGFDINDLVPAAPQSAVGSQLPTEIKPVQERDVLTKENPKALLNMLPPKLQEQVLAVINDPENKELYTAFMNGDESTLHQVLSPSRIENTLRYQMWTEHSFACMRGDAKLDVLRLYAPVCSKQTFYNIMQTRRLFWVLSPPPDMQALNKMAYSKALDRLYDILELPLTDKSGKVNTALANLQMKVFALLDTRINGPITQKHELTTKNVHIGVSADQVKQLFQQTQKEVEALNTKDEVEYKDVVQVEEFSPASARFAGDSLD